MDNSQSTPEKYTPDQISLYLERISFPPSLSVPTGEQHQTSYALEFLTTLQAYHLSSIPFENLSLHYSEEKIISLDKDDLFKKIVRRKMGRGGYCMELNAFLGYILLGMGFEVLSGGARVWAGGWRGWSHSINFVHIAGQTYMVDVGFGALGSTRPLPITPNLISSWGKTAAENRLITETRSNPILQPMWILQHRLTSSHPWTNIYSFTLTEFFPQDFNIMSFATCHREESWFRHKIHVVKWVREDDDIIGVGILDKGNFTRSKCGKMAEEKECVSEKERLEILKNEFGVILSESEVAAIRGSPVELTG